MIDPRKPSELLPYLKEKGFMPKKSLSQNFLIDLNILRKIVTTANVSKGESVLEIGPGPGALTKTLLEAGANVTSIETDSRFVQMLSEILPHEQLRVIEKDFLKAELTEPAKVIANTPYHITSPIIAKLSQHPHLFSEIFLTVQKDMAERICAKPGSKLNTSFAIFVHYYFEPSISFDINAGSFFPPPKVKSSLLYLRSKKRDDLDGDEKEFFQFVQKVFQQKRKMIRASIKHPKLEEVLRERGVTGEVRPEKLSVEDFLHLYHSLS